MVTHFNILAWEIPWTKEESGGLQSMGSQSATEHACTHHQGRPKFSFESSKENNMCFILITHLCSG